MDRLDFKMLLPFRDSDEDFCERWQRFRQQNPVQPAQQFCLAAGAKQLQGLLIDVHDPNLLHTVGDKGGVLRQIGPDVRNSLRFQGVQRRLDHGHILLPDGYGGGFKNRAIALFARLQRLFGPPLFSQVIRQRQQSRLIAERDEFRRPQNFPQSATPGVEHNRNILESPGFPELRDHPVTCARSNPDPGFIGGMAD